MTQARTAIIGLHFLVAATSSVLLASPGGAVSEARLLPRDASRLQAGRNLLSNGSFEAVAEGRPLSWETFGAPTPFAAVPDVGLHGKTAALVDTPGLADAPAAGLRQEVPANPGCTYELHGWLRVLEDRGGSVSLGWAALDARGRPLGQGEALLPDATSDWIDLSVAFQPPPQSAWLVVTTPRVRGGMRLLVDAVSLEIVRGSRQPGAAPVADGLAVREVGSNWALLAWAPVHGDLQVRYREAGNRAWETEPAHPDGHCTLLGLKPDTRYDYFVEPVPRTHYDAAGRAGNPPWHIREAGPRSLRTLPWQARTWNGLRLWPTQPLTTVPGDRSFPAIEAAEGALYVAECVGGGIHLSRVQPDSLEVEWMSYVAGPSLEILKKYLDQASAEGYIPYASVLGDYVSADEVATRYENLASFYEEYGHFWVGTGPFILETVSPVESSLSLARNPNYPDPATKWAGFGEPKIAEAEVDGPGQVVAGTEAVFDVYVTFQGEPYAADEISAVKYLVFDATGALVATGDAEMVADGEYMVTLSADETGQMEPGAAKIEVAVSPLAVSVPTFADLEFVVVAP